MRGASEHNLRDVDVDIPRDRLVAFTGVSGSGKTSLAFDTIFAEAQRRYLESVAPYARRLIQQAGAPHVVEISGLPPAVAIRQRTAGVSSRSTVGTLTTLSSLVRILYSRAGVYPAGAHSLAAEAFSRNTHAGACEECAGTGVSHDVTEELLVPDPSLSIREGAIAAWPGAWQGHNLRRIVNRLGMDVDAPWRELPASQRTWLLFTDEQPTVLIQPKDKDGGGGRDYNGTFRSARRHVRTVLATGKSESAREQMMRFVQSGDCAACQGSGLRSEARAVTFAGLGITELMALPLDDLGVVLRERAAAERDTVAGQLSRDLIGRLAVHVELGLGYLSLDRTTSTLSPGEAQRLRIGSQLHSGLFGVVYVMDEPSAGLHPADVRRLYDVLERLRDGGNSLFVVEHNLDVIRRADWVVDLGPGAGRDGGQILYAGPVPRLPDVSASATGRHLRVAPPASREARTPRGHLRIEGVTRNNLRDVTIEVPLGVLTAVTGVSGAGKSTLAIDVVSEAAHAMSARTGSTEVDIAALGRVTCTAASSCKRVVVVDQRPIGRTPRSNLATYTGLFDEVRRLFAITPAARQRGYGPGRFSFNVAGGRCESCDGDGSVAVELLFLPESRRPCTECQGQRYNAETLEVTYRGHTIADILALTVAEAADLMADERSTQRGLRALLDVGLGYLPLGQPATEISGGEAQRIKLASELQRLSRGASLYLLDEPTSGLHAADITVLLDQLERLVDAGNTVVMVEHDLDAVLRADWLIDVGPGGGTSGGRVIATGTPGEVARSGSGPTSEHLRRRLHGSPPDKHTDNPQRLPHPSDTRQHP